MINGYLSNVLLKNLAFFAVFCGPPNWLLLYIIPLQITKYYPDNGGSVYVSADHYQEVLKRFSSGNIGF